MVLVSPAGTLNPPLPLVPVRFMGCVVAQLSHAPKKPPPRLICEPSVGLVRWPAPMLIRPPLKLRTSTPAVVAPLASSCKRWTITVPPDMSIRPVPSQPMMKLPLVTLIWPPAMVRVEVSPAALPRRIGKG